MCCAPPQELVWLLHKTLEAAQREKRTCADFVAAESEQERLELLRHRERQAADLLGRAERAEAAAEAAKRDLDRRDRQMAQLRDEVRKLTERNQAKREVSFAPLSAGQLHLSYARTAFWKSVSRGAGLACVQHSCFPASCVALPVSNFLEPTSCVIIPSCFKT